MPFSDPKKRIANNKRWRKEKIAQGYGKALYARRKQRYQNEETLRSAIQEALQFLKNGDHPAAAVKALKKGLKDAPVVDKPIKYMPSKKTK